MLFLPKKDGLLLDSFLEVSPAEKQDIDTKANTGCRVECRVCRSGIKSARALVNTFF